MIRDYSIGPYAIPNPAIVFKEGSTNDFWNRRWYAAKQNINKNMMSATNVGNMDMIRIGEHLMNLGTIELNKEMNLIRAACPDFQFKDTKEFIASFNEIMMGKKQTEEAIARIKEAIQLNKKGNEINVAPHMASFFTSYFQAALTGEVNHFIGVHIKDLAENPEKFYAAWNRLYDGIIERAINKAVNKMLKPDPKRDNQLQLYGEKQHWEELANLYNSLPTFSLQFQNMIRSKFSTTLANLKKDLLSMDVLNKYKKNKNKSGVSSKIDHTLHLGSRRASIGGSVYEFVQSLMNMNGTITSHGTMVVEGEGVKTDMISLFDFSGDFTIDLSVLEDLNETLSASRSLEQARSEIERFYQRNFSKLDNNFIVYTSAKLYSLGSKFSGFKNGVALPLESLPDYIEEAGLSVSRAQDFLATAYNTVPGAIYESLNGTMKNNLRLILTAAAAKLMFDDFTTIGSLNIGASSGQAIHAFALGGVYLPSSYLFIKLGEALVRTSQDYTRWVNVKVNISASLNTDYSKEGSDPEVKNEIIDAWNENIESARASSSFSVKFLSNFKDIFNSIF